MENENKEIKNISDFFSKESPELTPEQKWNLVFEGWIDKIDEKKLMPNLFELKTWFESLEEFFSSTYLETLVFKYQTTNTRDYEFYFVTFTHVVTKIIGHLKDLDFEKDKYLLNFEEFIVEKIFEEYATSVTKRFPYLKDIYSPSSWFYSLRIFLQSIRNLVFELTRSNPVSQKAFFSLRKLYRKEFMSNSIIVSLLKGNFIPKMDKVYQQDICDIINDREDKKLKREIGIFFIFAFRIMKLNNFIEQNLNINRNISLTIPLILLLKKQIENILTFYDTVLKQTLGECFNKEAEMQKIDKIFQDLRLEYQKIYEGEFPYYFDAESEKINRRKLLKNTIIISDFAIQDMIESVAKLFKPEISGNSIFENYTSRAEKSSEVKEKLVKLHTKINNYFSEKGKITPADIFFDINQFIETDLNYLLFKDWNEFLDHYNKLVQTDFSPEFKTNLRAFHSFITKILKEMVDKKSG
ncbi:MAG: hypothetical protein NT166_06145 [Candidatus Aminicenantes bacterium]|nr:hypothetical protein [Candidatus Aminicenantes bacterium]